MNKQLLTETLSIQTVTGKTQRMQKYIKQFCKDNSLRYSAKKGNIYVTKGKAKLYPCVVAHTDTVHRIIEEFKVFESEGILYSMNGAYEQVGIGGDDKIGVFICLHFLLKLDIVKAVFFKDEENGGTGSSIANLKFFKDVSTIIQADRLGNSEIVQDSGGTVLFSDELLKHIEPTMKKHKRKLGYGTFTDCNILVDRNVGVSTMNIGCGYYRAHSSSEVVVINDVESAIEFIADIIEITKDRQWEHHYEYKSIFKSYHSYKGYYTPYVDEYTELCYYCACRLSSKEEIETGVCDYCIDDYDVEPHELDEMKKEKADLMLDKEAEEAEEEAADEEKIRNIDWKTDKVCKKVTRRATIKKYGLDSNKMYE